MVRDSVDGLLAHEIGNAGIAKFSGGAPGLLLEALYVAEPTIAQHLRADRFLPPTPLRVVVDMSGEQVALATEDLRRGLEPVDSAVLASPQVAELLPGLLQQARGLAIARGPEIAAAAPVEVVVWVGSAGIGAGGDVEGEAGAIRETGRASENQKSVTSTSVCSAMPRARAKARSHSSRG